MNDMPTNKKKLGFLFYFLLCIGIITFTICVGGLIREAYVESQGDSYYNAIAEISEQLEVIEYEEYTPEIDSAGETSENANSSGATTVRAINMAALQESVPNSRAWLRCEGTKINFPVVQGSDNEYYLNHLPNSVKNKLGSIFLDYRNAADFSDSNSLIYGHHIKSGNMFGALKYYKQQSYYNKHPQMQLYTEERSYLIELIAGYVADATKETLTIRFKDGEAFEQYIAEIRQRSYFVSDVEVSANDRLVTLCTCSYELDDARFVLVGKLVAVDTSD